MTKGEKIALGSVIYNTSLGILKYILGSFSGSLSLKADAYHSFLDILIPLLIFVGLKVTERRTKNFPFGLYKIENLLSLIIGVIMVFAGIEIVKEAVFNQSVIKEEMVAITSAVILILAMANYLWSCYVIKAGKEILSPSITSDGYHFRIESFTLLLIAFGLLGKDIRYFPIDKGLAVIIALSIFKVSLTIIWDAVKVLLDGVIDQETYTKIQATLSTHPMVDSVPELLIRRAGKYLFIEVVIVIKCNNIDLATTIKQELQGSIRNAVANIEHITIDAVKSAKTIYAVMADNNNGVISHSLAHAPFIALVKDVAEKKPEIIPNPIMNLEKQKGIQLVNFFKKHGVDTVITRGNVQNKGILTLLQNAGIKHVSVNFESIHEFINMYANSAGMFVNSRQHNINVH